MYALPVNQTGFISISLVDIEIFWQNKGIATTFGFGHPFQESRDREHDITDILFDLPSH